MEKIRQALERLDTRHREYLCNKLSVSPTTQNPKVLTALISISGLNILLNTLSDPELRVFDLLTREENGLIFSDIEKHLKISVADIESISESLQNKLLIYVFKNRKHLNNRFDKAYIFPELYSIIQNSDSDIGSTLKAAASDSEIKHEKLAVKDKLSILETVYANGSIITLDKLLQLSDQTLQKINSALAELYESGNLHIFYKLSYPFATILMLPKKTALNFALKQPTHTVSEIQNNYSMLLNMLHGYDVIKSNGLYFTQQGRFRKTDLKKLLQKMIPVQGLDGKELSDEITAQLSLYLLDILECTELSKTNVFTTLTPIRRYLHQPAKLSEILLKSINREVSNENFASPLMIPLKSYIDFIIKRVKDEPAILAVLKLEFIYFLCSRHKSCMNTVDASIEKYTRYFDNTLQFLIVLGQLVCTDGKIAPAPHITGAKEETTEKSIYINPDFSLIIPRKETPGIIQYNILAFSTVVKNDVIIHSQITKESVLNAFKRGMKARIFTETLEQHAKNELPQNMTFLIHEWIKQSLNLNIYYGTILEVNHQSFIDELDFKVPDSVIRRLSDTCAIVSEEMIDDIVKLGEKHKALIKIDRIG